jgi:glucuronate isomerase
MKTFMGEDFLLENDTAYRLYHEYAKANPIIDYHCHIDPQKIADDRRFNNITQVWLGADHYKWRLIRSNGVDECEITGDASDREKFQRFAEALPRAIGNPLYNWTHLELKRYFGYEGELNGKTAGEVWRHCNERLRGMSVRSIIRDSNVDAVNTTDDPLSTLEAHRKIKEDASFDVSVLPSWRPDRALGIGDSKFMDFISGLEYAVGFNIRSLEDLYSALRSRMDYFEGAGCRASDHGFDYIPCALATEKEAGRIFQSRLGGAQLTRLQEDQYKTALMVFMGREYARRGWVMMIHYGALRNINSVMFDRLGKDSGFDCIGLPGNAHDITGYLNALFSTGELPRTVLFSLHPGDDAMLGTVLGCFQGTDIAGKIQQGPGWWFNDTKSGMIGQMTSLANLSILGNFIGMLTDSRSFLSYTRHEYFRRILCNLIGKWAENGEVHCDIESLGGLINDICYRNAKRYFRV